MILTMVLTPQLLVLFTATQTLASRVLLNEAAAYQARVAVAVLRQTHAHAVRTKG